MIKEQSKSRLKMTALHNSLIEYKYYKLILPTIDLQKEYEGLFGECFQGAEVTTGVRRMYLIGMKGFI